MERLFLDSSKVIKQKIIMNFPKRHLQELHVGYFQVEDALKMILHSIFFNKKIISGDPLEVSYKGVTYVKVENKLLEKRMNDYFSTFLSKISRQAEDRKQDQEFDYGTSSFAVVLALFATIPKKVMFFTRSDTFCYEEWHIKLVVHFDRAILEDFSQRMTEVLLSIIRIINDSSLQPRSQLYRTSDFKLTIPSIDDSAHDLGIRDMVKKVFSFDLSGKGIGDGKLR